MTDFNDFVRKPYEEEAKRQLVEYRKENDIWNNPRFLTDEEVIKLMASYAAQAWQEGHEEGREEGYEEGERVAYEEGLKDGYGSGAGW